MSYCPVTAALETIQFLLKRSWMSHPHLSYIKQALIGFSHQIRPFQNKGLDAEEFSSLVGLVVDDLKADMYLNSQQEQVLHSIFMDVLNPTPLNRQILQP